MTNINSNSYYLGQLTGSDFIKKYDKDGDGKVTAEEVDAALNAEKDNSTNSANNTTTNNNNQTNNLPSQGATTNDLPLDFTFGNVVTDYDSEATDGKTVYDNQNDARKAFNSMKESYIESYIGQLLESGYILSEEEKKDLISFLNTKSAAFINQYFNKNAQGPYDMEAISAAYTENIQALLQARNEKKAEVEAKMEEYKQNSSASFDELLSLIDAADDEYITDSEYEGIIEQAINYIIGAMLNGEDISVFLNKINPNNQNAQYYRQAMDYINTVMNSANPEQQALYLDYAETALKKYLGQKANDGSSAIVDAAYAQQKENQKQAAMGDVNAVNDDRTEAYSQELEAQVEAGELTKEEAEAKLAEYQKKLENISEAYLNQDSYGVDVQKDYAAFIDKVEEDYEAVSEEIAQNSDSEAAYQDLKNKVEDAGLYADTEETEEIMNSTKDFIVSSILSGEENSVLAAIMPNYTNNKNYKEAKALLDGLASSATPQADYEKAMQLIEEMLSDLDTDFETIQTGVENEETRRAEALKAENIEKYTNTLTTSIDKLVETYSNSDEIVELGETDKDAAKAKVDKYETKMNAALEAFLAQYTGDGTNIEEEFNDFVEKIEAEYKEVQDEINDITTDTIERKLLFGLIKYTKTVDVDLDGELLQEIQDAGISISDAEQDDINNAAVNYVIGQVTRDNGDTTLVENLYPGLAGNDKYKEAISLLENLEGSITPKDDYEKAKALLEEALNETYNVDNMQDAADVEESKNVNLQPGELTEGIWGYERNDTAGGDQLVSTNYNIVDGKIVWSRNGENADTEKAFTQLRERIHEQMQAQLGDLYIAEDIDAYFDQAVYNMALGLEDPMAWHTVKEIVDATLVEFNEIATAGLHGEESDTAVVEGLNKSVILSNAGKIDDYYTGAVDCSGRRKNWGNATDDYNNNATNRLNSIKDATIEAIKAQLGDAYVDADIQNMVNNAISSTVNECPKNDIAKDDGLIEYWNWQYNTQDLYSLFFEKLNTSLAEYKESHNIEDNKSTTSTTESKTETKTEQGTVTRHRNTTSTSTDRSDETVYVPRNSTGSGSRTSGVSRNVSRRA